MLTTIIHKKIQVAIELKFKYIMNLNDLENCLPWKFVKIYENEDMEEKTIKLNKQLKKPKEANLRKSRKKNPEKTKE